jgi:hypothetical protein
MFVMSVLPGWTVPKRLLVAASALAVVVGGVAAAMALTNNGAGPAEIPAAAQAEPRSVLERHNAVEPEVWRTLTAEACGDGDLTPVPLASGTGAIEYQQCMTDTSMSMLGTFETHADAENLARLSLCGPHSPPAAAVGTTWIVLSDDLGLLQRLATEHSADYLSC